MNVLITGISGRLGQAIVGCLFNENPFKRVVGLDRQPPTILGPAHYIETDLRMVDMGDLLAMNEIDVVIHCATTRTRVEGDEPIDALMPVVEGLRHTDVKRLVVPSKHWVYTTSNDPMSESDFQPTVNGDAFTSSSSSAKKNIGHSEGSKAREVEYCLARCANDAEMPPIVIPRLGTLISQGNQDAFNAILNHRFLLTSAAARQHYQVMHIDDAANFLIRCATQPNLLGAYNIASDEVLSLETIAGILEKKRLVLPVWALKLYVGTLYRLGLLDFRFRDLVRVQLGAPMDTQRMYTMLGRPRLSSRQALALWRVEGHGNKR